jgi:hypothetical protein
MAPTRAPTVTQLQERVARLQLQVERLARTVSPPIIHRPWHHDGDGTIEAARIVLRPEEDGAGAPALVLQGSDGTPRAEILLDDVGAPQIVLNDDSGRRRLSLQVSPHGEPSVYLWGTEPIQLIALRATDSGAAELTLSADVQARAVFSATPQGVTLPVATELAAVRELDEWDSSAEGAVSDVSLQAALTPSHVRHATAGSEPQTAPRQAERPRSTNGSSAPGTTADARIEDYFDGEPTPPKSPGPLVDAWKWWAKGHESAVRMVKSAMAFSGDLRLDLYAIIDAAQARSRTDRGTRLVLQVVNGGSDLLEEFSFGSGTRAFDATGSEHGMLGEPLCLDYLGELASGQAAARWHPHRACAFMLWFPTLDADGFRRLVVQDTYTLGGAERQGRWVLDARRES